VGYGTVGAGALLLLAGAADGLVAFGSLLIAARLRQLQPCNLAQPLDVQAESWDAEAPTAHSNAHLNPAE
jgi:hypothetical protein